MVDRLAVRSPARAIGPLRERTPHSKSRYVQRPRPGGVAASASSPKLAATLRNFWWESVYREGAYDAPSRRDDAMEALRRVEAVGDGEGPIDALFDLAWAEITLGNCSPVRRFGSSMRVGSTAARSITTSRPLAASAACFATDRVQPKGREHATSRLSMHCRNTGLPQGAQPTSPRLSRVSNEPINPSRPISAG
jgi:hypothetical protein